MVVLGNPPYSGISLNKGDWIDDLLHGKAPGGGTTASYYEIDGKPLGERKVWLQDDYVKFFRFGQWRIEQTGVGILGYVSNNGYLDSPTFRGMRHALMETFTEIYILDLHGNARKKETAPDGSSDDNVFDIMQGVAIGLFVKEPGKLGPAKVYHTELWGSRESKYSQLLETEIDTLEWNVLAPQPPFFLFVPWQVKLEQEYRTGWRVTDIMPLSSVGVQTSRDDIVVGFNEDEILRRISDFRSAHLNDNQIRDMFFPGRRGTKYLPGDTRGWRLPRAREAIRNDKFWDHRVQECLYRPFDKREMYYVPWMVDWPRQDVMKHLLEDDGNIGLIVGRAGQAVGSEDWDVVLCCKTISDMNIFRRGGGTIFPLYLYPTEDSQSALFESHKDSQSQTRRPNLAPAFIAEMETRLGLIFQPAQTFEVSKTSKVFTPEDVFHYAYAVLHSPTYRARYAEFLKIDFPRLPLTCDVGLFRRLCGLGRELVALHLLESPAVAQFVTRYPVPGDNRVEAGYPKFRDPPGSCVYINPTQYFEGVSPQVWEFQIGGYQVLDKWLKDRRGRRLSYDDLTHYQKIVVALQETIRRMAEIDVAIPAWPLE